MMSETELARLWPAVAAAEAVRGGWVPGGLPNSKQPPCGAAVASAEVSRHWLRPLGQPRAVREIVALGYSNPAVCSAMRRLRAARLVERVESPDGVWRWRRTEAGEALLRGAE